jgi:serine/threonine-protein kinase
LREPSSSSGLVCPRCRDTSAGGEEESCPRCGARLCEPEDLARIGLRVHNYEILEILGVGGMGVVYRARHTSLLKSVALKVLNERYARRRDAAVEMLREAQAATRIHHPHIVDVTDFGHTPEGSPYIVMEHLEGESLSATLARAGRLPVPRAVGILRQVASALAAAHHAGIVHRDLKPENIFLLRVPSPAGGPGHAPPEQDFVKLLDFGLAKVTDQGPSSRTRAGVVAGTPWYMSPEQAKNLTVDGRSDIYSLGVVFYQLVTGRVPFPGPSAAEIFLGHIDRRPEPPASLSSEVDDMASRVIMRCLEKRREDRFQSMEELLEALRYCASDLKLEAGEILPPLARPAGPPLAVTVSAELARQVWAGSAAGAASASVDRSASAPAVVPLNPTVSSDLIDAVRLPVTTGVRREVSVPQPLGQIRQAAHRAPGPLLRPLALSLAVVLSLLLGVVGYGIGVRRWFRPQRAGGPTVVAPATVAVRPSAGVIPDGPSAGPEGLVSVQPEPAFAPPPVAVRPSDGRDPPRDGRRRARHTASSSRAGGRTREGSAQQAETPPEVAPAANRPEAGETPPTARVAPAKGAEKQTPKPARSKRYNDWIVDPEL